MVLINRCLVVLPSIRVMYFVMIIQNNKSISIIITVLIIIKVLDLRAVSQKKNNTKTKNTTKIQKQKNVCYNYH